MSNLKKNLGLFVAFSIFSLWALHFATLVTYFDPQKIWHYPLILIQTFLNVGLFITAHDAMHGTVTPSYPGLNKKIGQLALFFYAGFSFAKLEYHHRDHHRYPASLKDPDYTHDQHENYLNWLKDFIFFYFGWKEALFMLIWVILITLACQGNYIKMLCIFAIPSILSALQLFTFGTFLPHRKGIKPFSTPHNCRSIPLPTWLSFLTCYHFGYHHEHHSYPHVPWWQLPKSYQKMSNL